MTTHKITRALLLVLCTLQACLGGDFIQYNYGGRDNMLYVPTASGTKPLPLFVMLHGCTQDPTDFATGTKMNTYGEQNNFFVVYPQQTSAANSQKCWNWFLPQHQSRGAGEPELIVSIAMSLGSKYKIDNSSIFVGGLSAGAAMADILGATYPDVFRGAAVGSGLEYKAATSVISALTAMTSGGPSPATQGQVAYNEMGKEARTLLILVTHGTSDYTVYPVNGQQVTDSYAKTLDLVLGNGTSHGYITDTPTTTTKGQVPNGGRAYTTYTYANAKTQETLIQYITVTGMGHAWSGGSSSGTYTDPQGPDASQIMVQFFLNSSVKPTTSSSSGTTSTTAAAAATSTTSTASVTTASVTSTITSSSSSSSTTGGNTLVFTSIASEDGFVGKLPVDSFSTELCQVGGKGAFTLDDYRIILSFDTSTLPASFSSAVLTITRQSIDGNLKPLVVDLKAGTFASTTQLNQMAYYGTPSARGIGYMPIPASDGSSTSFEIPASNFKYITSSSTRTQFMLRQDTTTTLPAASASILQIFDGQATLTITL